MALKGKRSGGDRRYHNTTVFVSAAAERGGVLTLSTTSSGSAFGDSAVVGAYAANPSGRVVLGVLVEDFVDKDLTRTHLNWHKSEQIINSPASVLNQGFVTTNMTEGAITTPGPAYLGHSGRIGRVSTLLGAGAEMEVGVIETIPDEDGYVRFRFNLPK